MGRRVRRTNDVNFMMLNVNGRISDAVSCIRI